MGGRLLQLVSALAPQAGDEAAQFAWAVAQNFGVQAATFTWTPHPDPAAESAWRGLDVHAPRPGEAALTAWHRALDALEPNAVWVHGLGGTSPARLLDLRERGVPYAVFLHDYMPVCPTHRLWHRRQERCSGPGRTGWKCAWCTNESRGDLVTLPLRWLGFRQRPQAWRTALLRAEALIAPSRFAREYWIAQGAPPERIAVIPPIATADAGAAPASQTPAATPRDTLIFSGGWDEAAGAELLGAALDQIRRPLRIVAGGHGDLTPDAAARLRAALAARHRLDLETVTAPGALTVVPARWEMPYSREVFIAQAAGQRVVATAAGGLAEQIIHGVNGFLTAPDDPIALAESIQEALDFSAPDWDAALVAENARADAAAATAQLRRLLKLLTEGAAEIALQLEHHSWLAQLDNGQSAEENAETLITALRLVGIEAVPGSGQQAFAQRAEMFSRRRWLDLNHAIAFFRGSGCRRVAPLPAVRIPGDERQRLQNWGVELVPAEALPCGVIEDRRENDPVDPAWLRRRFPQLRAAVAFTSAGVETAAWD